MTQQSESQAMAHEATLFVMQMAGDSMINAGIHNGDLLIVDRSLAPVPGDVVAAVMDDEIAIKRLVSRAGITILHAENPRYPDYMPSNGASPAIWGIVTDVIHPLISSPQVPLCGNAFRRFSRPAPRWWACWYWRMPWCDGPMTISTGE